MTGVELAHTTSGATLVPQLVHGANEARLRPVLLDLVGLVRGRAVRVAVGPAPDVSVTTEVSGDHALARNGRGGTITDTTVLPSWRNERKRALRRKYKHRPSFKATWQPLLPPLD